MSVGVLIRVQRLMDYHVFFNQVSVRYLVADGGVAHLGYVISVLQGQQVAVSNSERDHG